MRLDFEAFTILGPADTVETGGGACVDSFVASAVSRLMNTRSTLYIPALTLPFSSVFFDSFSITLLYSRRRGS